MTDPPISYSITLKLLTPLTSSIIYNKNLHIDKGICEPYTGNIYNQGVTPRARQLMPVVLCG